ADRVTANVALVVPMLPSVTVTSLIASAGASSPAQPPSLRRTETVPAFPLAVATSGRPSRLKSPTATPKWDEAVLVFTGGRKAPVPVPSSTPTVPVLGLAMARSALPSLLKSAEDRGPAWESEPKLPALVNEPVPLPRSTPTKPPEKMDEFDVARS